MGETAEIEPIHPCCGGYREHRYRCPARVWPTTATPEIRRQAIRGDCIALAHAWIEDLGVRGLDYQQRKRLTGILAQVWDDGCEYGRGLGSGMTAASTGGGLGTPRLRNARTSGGTARSTAGPMAASRRSGPYWPASLAVTTQAGTPTDQHATRMRLQKRSRGARWRSAG